MAGWTVKYEGSCSKCGRTLHVGEPAVYDWARKQMWCIECPPAAVPSPTPIDVGVAGRSARGEHSRLQAKREAELKGRWGDRVGGLITRFVDEPQAIRAWGVGAHGEELLGAALARVPNLIVLNDRKVDGTRRNIDHVAIAPAGVFVIDAKNYKGSIEVVNRGGLFSNDLRLMIGGANRSRLTENMGWQLKAVSKALLDARVDPLPPVTAVLCFVDGNWPFLLRPKSFEGVRLEDERSVIKLLSAPVVLEQSEIDRLAHILASALPAK